VHPNSELEHFGVKGMRWGVRKNRGGSSASTSKKARTPEEAARRKRNRRIAIAGAAAVVAYGPTVMVHGTNFLRTLAGVKMEQRGRTATANIFADRNGIPAFETVNLVFNGNTNRWE
jgi:hypothetical protein